LLNDQKVRKNLARNGGGVEQDGGEKKVSDLSHGGPTKHHPEQIHYLSGKATTRPGEREKGFSDRASAELGERMEKCKKGGEGPWKTVLALEVVGF